MLRPRQLFRASLRGRNALGHVTRAVLCENLQVKCHRPDGSHDRDPHFEPAQAKCIWTLCGNLQEKWPGPEARRSIWTFHKSYRNRKRKFTSTLSCGGLEPPI